MDHCPGRTELEDFLNHRLPAKAEGPVLAHLDGCPVCQRVLEGLTAGPAGDTARSRLATIRAGRSGGGGDSLTSASAFRTVAAHNRQAQPLTTSASSGGSTALSHGALLADHPDYAVVRELGAGGMGVVYLARNRLLERDDVLKVIGPDFVSNPGILDRFLREMRAVARLRHPNIVSAYTAFRWGGSLVFAMEYVDGLDLRRIVQSTGSMPVLHACSYVRQAAMALQHAFEEGMVHRDIKPGNLMLTHQKNRPLIKVLDFGLAKAASEQDAGEFGFEVSSADSMIEHSLTRTGQMLGTPAFIAPEQIADSRGADTRADIYSLGCTLYYLLSSRPPFEGGTLYETLLAQQSTEARPLNQVRRDVPGDLAAVVATMMEKSPDRRYQQPAEVAEALSPFLKKRSSSTGTLAFRDSGIGKNHPGASAGVANRSVAGGLNPSRESQTEAIRSKIAAASPDRVGADSDYGLSPPPLLPPVPVRDVTLRRSAMIGFSCEGCGKAQNVAAALAGRDVRCPDCGTMTTVAASVFAPAPKRKKRKKWTIDWEACVALGVGFALAVVAPKVPLVGMVIGCLATVIHELGHTATSWLFGSPAVPSFDLVYGGGITRGIGRQPAIIVGVYAILASLMFLRGATCPGLSWVRRPSCSTAWPRSLLSTTC